MVMLRVNVWVPTLTGMLAVALLPTEALRALAVRGLLLPAMMILPETPPPSVVARFSVPP